MARLIALEWDAREARIAVANPRGGELVVEEAFAVDLTSSTSPDAISDREVGERLAAAFAQRGLGGSELLVALSRASIELRTLSLPMAPPEEIPDMVRFQAMQAFTSIGEDWPLDYVELEGHDDSISVLAAVVSPKEVQQIQAVCNAAGAKTRCLVLRPFAAVSLLQRSESIDLDRGSLIVDLLPEGADLTAVSHGQVVFMRSVRLPSHSEPQAQARALIGELRRTIGAAQNQMGGGQIQQIIICGSAQEHAELHQTVAESLSHDIIPFDPFGEVRVTRKLEGNLPESSGRYAPLLGMLAGELPGNRHTIDFLNPRRRPAPPSRKRRNVALAAALLAVVAAASLTFVWYKGQLNAEIAQYNSRLSELKTEVEKAKVLVEKVNAVEKFTDGDITWLDEIREVASRLPDADHVILDEVTVGTDATRGGRLKLMGHVVQPGVIAELEKSLRYGDNVVTGRIGIPDHKRKDYPYLLETTVLVPPDVRKDGHSLGRPPVTQQLKPADTEDAQQVTTAATPEATPPAARAQPTLDKATLDKATPDKATPDKATPEKATPEKATPDEASPDEASPDEASPDEPTSDEPISDEPPSDEQTPVEQSGSAEGAAATNSDAGKTSNSMPRQDAPQPAAEGTPSQTEPIPAATESPGPVNPWTEEPSATDQAGSELS